MAYPEPDYDIFGPVAEEANVLADDDGEHQPCSECGDTWPASELDDECLCPDCLIEQLEITRDVE